jgi:protein gp37
MAKRFNPDVTLQLLWIDKETGKPMPPAFNGKIITHPERLSIPLKRRKPTVYAVWNDLFFEAVPVNFLEDSLAVITRCPQHIFLVLTKRAQRLNLMTQDRLRVSRTDTWPIKNLWMGITVCNQQEADKKIPVFLPVPGKKFLSIEPMLGEITLKNPWLYPCIGVPDSTETPPTTMPIDAVILGGETGPGARPMHPDWVRSVRDQCAAAGVPFFFKQWGKIGGVSNLSPFSRFHKEWIPAGYDPKTNNGGRLLDGRTHDELPWPG